MDPKNENATLRNWIYTWIFWSAYLGFLIWLDMGDPIDWRRFLAESGWQGSLEFLEWIRRIKG